MSPKNTLPFLRRIYGEETDLEGVLTLVHISKWDLDEDGIFTKRKRAEVRVFKYHFSELESLDWSKHVDANKDGADIYFGTMLRSEEFLNARGSSRGGKEVCTISTCLSLDIDFLCKEAHATEALPESLDDVEDVFDLGPVPSILVNSGHGVHAHWVYKNNVVLEAGDKRAIKEYEGLRKSTHHPYVKLLKDKGWHCDSTYTIDRVWRIPGFLNWKVPENPVLVTVEFGLDGELECCDIEELPKKNSSAAKEPNKAPVNATPSKKSEAETSEDDEDVFEVATERVKKLRKLYTGMTMPKSIIDMPAELFGMAEQDIQSVDPDKQDRGRLVWKLLIGESICEKGNRDHSLTKVCGIISLVTKQLGRQFRDDELSCIVEDLMGSSLQKWVDDSDDDTDITREYEKASEKLKRLKEKDVESMDRGLLALSRKFGAKSMRRYSDIVVSQDENEEEDEDPDDEDTLSKKDLLKKGIITHQTDKYVYDWGTHQYFTAPARDPIYFMGVKDVCWPDKGDCPFQHAYVTEKGERKTLSISQLCTKYGSAAEKAYYSFDVAGTTFDQRTRTFIINPAPRRHEEAVFDKDIDTWLELLGGEDHFDTLCAWLAGLSHLDKPCAALYLDGPPGCGKSLFSLGATQLWSEGSVMYEGVATVFNEDILRSPVCLIDEGFTNDNHKNASKQMRRLVAQQTHRVNKKGGAIVPLHTYLRILIAANNDKVLFSGKEENQSANDTLAMGERILYVKVPNNKARDFFKEHNRDNSLTNKWIAGGAFAKHVLWLGQNIDLSNSGRFLVEGKSSDMHNKMLFEGTERGKVCESLVRFAECPDALYKEGLKMPDPALKNGMLIGEGYVAVNAGTLSSFWVFLAKMGQTTTAREPDPIDHRHAQSHLKALSGKETSVKGRVKLLGVSSNYRYWLIPIELVILYSETYDFGDSERILKNASESSSYISKLLAARQSR